MPNYFGARYNLDRVINKHLFIISPNNSGSTYLQNILATSHQTWNLNREGQHTFGYAGACKSDLIWAASRSSIDTLRESSRYDWEKTKKAWYFQAFSKSETATVFVTKSPPFLVVTDMLKARFTHARFIFMVRNPYAVVEGISRRKRAIQCAGKDVYKVAAKHIMNCFKYQKNNIETYSNDLFFTYEQLCSDHVLTESRIKHFIPELGDLELNQKIVVKNLYFEPLRDMNLQQIKRLSRENIKEINTVFEENTGLMDYFGYEVLNG